MMENELLVAGHINFDYIIDIDEFGDMNTSVSVNDYKCYHGGTAGNVAYVAASMGINTSLFSCVGDDFIETDYSKKLDGLGIVRRTVQLTRNPVATPVCFVVTDKNGNQKSYMHDDTLKVYNRIVSINPEEMPNYIHITTTPPEFTVFMAKTIKEKTPDKIISFCPGQNLRLYNEHQISDMFQYADILFMNEHENKIICDMIFKNLYNDEIFLDGPDIMITTMGEHGCKIESGSTQYIDAVSVDEVVDPTGAGDAFAGAFLSEYIKGKSASSSARFASAVAAYVVEASGCQTNIPSYQQAFKRMSQFYR